MRLAWYRENPTLLFGIIIPIRSEIRLSNTHNERKLSPVEHTGESRIANGRGL